MARPAAAISVDVDPVDLHLLGYAYRDLPPDPSVYLVALPRLLEAFKRHGVRATFFVVGRDAATHQAAVSALAQQGHEVASHSMTHPMPLAQLPLERLHAEVNGSKRALAAAAGTDVVGFRAPNWDVSERVLETLAGAGYRYDASLFPSLLQVPARALLALKARDPRALLSMRPWPMSLDPRPRARKTREGTIALLPVSVIPGLGFPLYHSARYLLGDQRFLQALDGFVARGEPLSYPLHAVDVMGLAEDRVDARLGRHPGMERPLAAKLELLDKTLAAIAARFETVPCRELLGRLGFAV
jgi:peptidoglycan/xylan/chitin deacetylase (PgdA/CDA1 family)